MRRRPPTRGLSDAAHDATRVIVVSLEDRRLALVEDGAVMKVYPVAVGQDTTPSPTGTFTIVERVENPTYYHEGKVVPPGPGNPVGTRWMGLSQHGYGIHGTNAPRSIGKAASHGCIRMRQADLEELFAEVRSGDTVEIVGERNEETAAIFGGRRGAGCCEHYAGGTAQAGPSRDGIKSGRGCSCGCDGDSGCAGERVSAGGNEDRHGTVCGRAECGGGDAAERLVRAAGGGVAVRGAGPVVFRRRPVAGVATERKGMGEKQCLR